MTYGKTKIISEDCYDMLSGIDWDSCRSKHCLRQENHQLKQMQKTGKEKGKRRADYQHSAEI